MLLQSQLYDTLQKFSFEFKVLLTGTPIQNHLAELFSLLHFLDPEKFPNADNFPLENSDLDTEEAVCSMDWSQIGSAMLSRCPRSPRLLWCPSA